MNKAFSFGLAAAMAIGLQMSPADASTEISVDNGIICDTLGGA